MKESLSYPILSQNGRIGYSTYQPSQLPLGLWLQRPELDFSQLALSLKKSLHPFKLILSVLQLDPKFVTSQNIPEISLVPHITTGEIDLSGSFIEYNKEVPSAVRQNVNRRIRRVTEKLGSLSLDVNTDPLEMEKCVREFASLESASWKGKLGTALKLGDIQSRFYTDVMEHFSKKNQARIYILRAGDITLAMRIAIHSGNVLYLLKTTYNHQYKTYSPGVLITYFVIRSLYADDPPVRQVEFYGSLNDAQKPWITGKRTLYHANVYEWPWLKRLHAFHMGHKG